MLLLPFQGKPFMFDKDSVRFSHSAHGGEVLFEGVWGGNGQRYRVLMRTGSDKGDQLQVAARHVCEDGQQTDLEGEHLRGPGELWVQGISVFAGDRDDWAA